MIENRTFAFAGLCSRGRRPRLLLAPILHRSAAVNVSGYNCASARCKIGLRVSLGIERSALTERRYRSLTLRLAQLSLRGFHIARRLLAKQDRAELVPLIIARSEFFLRVRALKINTRRRHAEIANKIHP
jgi:hypothetical protein